MDLSKDKTKMLSLSDYKRVADATKKYTDLQLLLVDQEKELSDVLHEKNSTRKNDIDLAAEALIKGESLSIQEIEDLNRSIGKLTRLIRITKEAILKQKGSLGQEKRKRAK